MSAPIAAVKPRTSRAVTSSSAVAPPRDGATLALLALCFVLSGFAALVYQTAWMRQFGLVFGTSELAVATVLAAYMGGLALGAWVIERLLPRISRPVLTYAVLELGIAATAVLLVPALLAGSRALLAIWFGGQAAPPSSEQLGLSFFYLLSAFVALVLPTALMGATLPLLARHAVQAREQIGRRIGLLYASNTAGAVVGALATAFVLLPNLGLRGSIWVGAAANALVFLLAVLVVRQAPAGAAWLAETGTAPRPVFRIGRPPAPGWVLPLMLLAGAVSFLHEVLWTRMLAQVVGSSIYAFGVMLGSFLSGIALGGGAGALLARSRGSSITALVVALFAAGVWVGVAFLLLDALVPAKAGLYSNLLFGFALLLPLTFAIGTTYPLAVRILADRAEDAAPASARVYAWNTVGGIVGSLAAGFLIIPALRYEGTIRLAAGASLALSLLALLLLERRRAWIGAAVAVATLAGVLAFRPGVPERLLLASPLNVGGSGRIIHYDVGRSASVVVLKEDGGLALRTNGLPEALMDSPGMPPRFSGEFWMSSLAVIANPAARDMLIVGFGGGVVVEGVPPSVRRIDVIELEPKVIEANRRTVALRKFDPLADPRVNVITNDARGALALTTRRYDAIVSQPSHPWTAGASHLYTREFMQLAREHLADGGVFVQWMNVAFLDEGLLRALTATLIDVFGAVRIYRPDPNTLVFLAARRPIDVEAQVARAGGAPITVTPGHYARFGINTVEDLVGALAVDEAGAQRLAADARPIVDDTNRMAVSSVFELGRGLNADTAGRVLAAYDPLQYGAGWLYQGLGQRLDFGYIARRQMFFRGLDPSALDRVRRMAANLGESEQGQYVRMLVAVALGNADLGRRLAQDAAAAYPHSPLLRYAALQPSLPRLVRGETTPETAALLADLPPDARAVIDGSRLLLQGRYGELAELDSALAQAAFTAPWYPEAVQLRAEWRSRVANPELLRALADQAIGLLDRLIVVQPSLAAYATRARAALNAGRSDVLLESIANVAQWTVTMGRNVSDAEQRARGRATLQELLKLLEGRDRDPGIDVDRLQEVRTRIDAAIQGFG
ncbi:MAG: fused MFS/spermidine synthase [Steroidobacteraceae bacterium]